MPLFKAPGDFTSDKPSQWTNWKQYCARFHIANRLHKETGNIWVSLLIYAMGKQAEHILKSFDFTGDSHREDCKRVQVILDTYFRAQRSVVYETARFNQRIQEAEENVECLIKALHILSENCDFGNAKFETIRDRLVIRLTD